MKKLFIYDFKTLARRLAVPFIILLCDVLLFLGMNQLASSVQTGALAGFVHLTRTLSMAAFVIIEITCLVLLAVFAWVLFYDLFLSRRAYLFRTLPVSRGQSFLALTLSVVAWIILYALFSCLLIGLVIVQAGGETVIETMASLHFDELIVLTGLGMICQMTYAWFCGVLAMLLASKQGRLAKVVAIAYGIALYYGGQLVFVLPAMLLSGTSVLGGFGASEAVLGESMEFFRLLMLTLSGWYVLLDLLCFWYSSRRIRQGVDVF